MKKIALILVLNLMGQTLIGGQPETLAESKIIREEIRVLPDFNALSVDLPGSISVVNGGMPKIIISASQELTPVLEVQVKNKTLILGLKEGAHIDPLKLSGDDLYLEISVPFLTRLDTYGKNHGVGEISVRDIDTDLFECNILFGKIILEGQVNELKIKSSNESYYRDQGILNAQKLRAKHVDARILGSNRAQVFASESLAVTLRHDASLSYFGNPPMITWHGKAEKVGENTFTVQTDNIPSREQKPIRRLRYVEVELRNNSIKSQNFFIKGPNENGLDFSYGFPLMPYGKRSKTVPVGTRIFLDSGIHRRPLLTIEANDDGASLDLFNTREN